MQFRQRCRRRYCAIPLQEGERICPAQSARMAQLVTNSLSALHVMSPVKAELPVLCRQLSVALSLKCCLANASPRLVRKVSFTFG